MTIALQGSGNSNFFKGLPRNTSMMGKMETVGAEATKMKIMYAETTKMHTFPPIWHSKSFWLQSLKKCTEPDLGMIATKQSLEKKSKMNECMDGIMLMLPQPLVL